MSAVDRGGGTFRNKVQEMLRSSILDAAWLRARETPWSQMRLIDVAEDVGVSRQTIYNEFGSKDLLASALFEREVAKFMEEIREISANADSLPKALRRSLAWMVEETAKHPMLRRMVSDARAGRGETLLPVLTVRADVIVLPMRIQLTELYCDLWPSIPRSRVELIADLFVRFVISLVIMPTDLDRDSMVDLMVGMAVEIDPTNPTTPNL